MMGGAWESAAILRAEETKAANSLDDGTTANTAGENETPCTDTGCRKGACIAGIVEQQS